MGTPMGKSVEVEEDGLSRSCLVDVSFVPVAGFELVLLLLGETGDGEDGAGEVECDGGVVM